MSAPNPKELILLVGGNPLPNYVAACALKDKLRIEQVHLFYTKQVEDVTNNLRECLKKKGFQLRDSDSFIDDAASAEKIRRACNDIARGSHLHYTGGTNTMAVHVYAEWKRKGGNEH